MSLTTTQVICSSFPITPLTSEIARVEYQPPSGIGEPDRRKGGASR